MSASGVEPADVLNFVLDFALRPENVQEPYAAFLRDAAGTLRGPSELTSDELGALRGAVDGITDVSARIRVHDILMLRTTGEEHDRHENAVLAEIGELLDSAPRPLTAPELHLCTRGAALARQASSLHLARLDLALVSRMERRSGGLEAVNLAIARGRIPANSTHTARVAALLVAATDRAEASSADIAILREALRWSKRHDAKGLTASTAQRLAARLRDRALTLASDTGPGSAPQAVTDVNEAMDALQHDKTSSADALREQLSQARRAAYESLIGSMQEVVTEFSVPVEMPTAAASAITGRTGPDAIDAFLSLLPFAPFGPAVHDATEQAAKSLLSRFSMSRLGPSGQVVARVDPRKDETTYGFGVPTKVWRQMVDAHQIRTQLVAHAIIAPALRTLREEHRLVLDDFIVMAQSSGLVPEGRERRVGRALFAGYDGDSLDAIERLGPQVEHIVRTLLQRHGVPTSRMNSNKGVIENSLTSLMKPGVIDSLLGTDICFEIRALFCSPFGPNLRNDHAHGLRDDETSSPLTLYAWWFCWKLICASIPGPSTLADSP